MFRTTCSVLLAGIFLGTFVHVGTGQETPAIWQYLGRRAARLTGEIPEVPDTKEGWEEYRAELTVKLSSTLGLGSREPMKAAVTETDQQGELVFEQVAYRWAENAYVSATVIRSRQAGGPQPAVVMPSGWLGHHTFRPYREFVHSLARKGVLVLFIDDPRAGRRQAPYAGLYASAAAIGTPVAGIQVFDALRGLDYLLTRTDVDSGRIGVAGFGPGALQAYMAAALEPGFQFVVAVEGTTTYNALVQQAVAGNGQEDPSVFVGGILEFADMDRVAASIAPRPVLVAGRAGGGRWASTGYTRVLQTMKSVYALYDAEDRIRELRDQSSGEMTPYADPTIDWLETSVLPTLEKSAAPVAACGKPEDPDFSMLRFVQRRAAEQAATAAVEPTSEDAWQQTRDAIVSSLRVLAGPDDTRGGSGGRGF